ncbi:MAG: hypothetical protein QOH88_1795 [Verrucomicrobiota bacterium]|jgi:hypothetical protein
MPDETSEQPSAPEQFNLTPHPRILAMLGEIVLPQWKCLAELIDNAVDAFLEANRAGTPISSPHITITTPTAGITNPKISVRDNGPGMDASTLEKAARAGWTSHDPINNLGLFGMGFNIATARLAQKTTIWTTRKGDPEWVGMGIDFDDLISHQKFVTAVLTKPKGDPDVSGTEIEITKIKPDQKDWFSKPSNRTVLGKHLGRIYSAMLGPARDPIAFRLDLNGNQVRARRHCVWGGADNGEPRSVETARHGTVDAFQSFDRRLGDRRFCLQCWNWLPSNIEECPSCGAEGRVVMRERRVHGWIGIQRFLDESDYGLDFLRHGRKIEIGNKDLFKLPDEATDTEVLEYPIDDPRNRGRIVGEVHLDHCSVPYTKDRFVREDAAWAEMVEIVRGVGPLRPDFAAKAGVGENSSPLFKLFQAFRRSSPHNRRVGGWAKLLVVPDNERAKRMFRNFEAGEPDYQTDRKWWELAEQADADVLRNSGGTGGESDDDDDLGGEQSPTPEGGEQQQGETRADPVQPQRQPVPNLSQVYQDDITSQRYEVQAFSVAKDDPFLASGELFDPTKDADTAWALKRSASGPWSFYVNLKHPVFQSTTMTPMDALLTQIAFTAADFARAHGPQPFAQILSKLRARYAASSYLNPAVLSADAMAQLIDIARSVTGRVDAETLRAFFDDIGPSHQDAVRITMASRGVANPQGSVEDGSFLQYATPRTISDFVLTHPEAFFDGQYWDDQYSTLDYGSAAATDEARKGVTSYYASLLADAVWLAQQGSSGLETATRERLMRASLATVLLAGRPAAT